MCPKYNLANSLISSQECNCVITTKVVLSSEYVLISETLALICVKCLLNLEYVCTISVIYVEYKSAFSSTNLVITVTSGVYFMGGNCDYLRIIFTLQCTRLRHSQTYVPQYQSREFSYLRQGEYLCQLSPILSPLLQYSPSVISVWCYYLCQCVVM